MPDFNNASEQREGGLIPEETLAVVHMTVRPGSAGDGGWLKRSKDGSSLGIDAEFTVVEGIHAKRKFWKLFTIEGATDGHQKAAEISASQLRAILESARGFRPDDESEAAKTARRVTTFGEFNGLRFIAKIGIEKGKDGYKDKNTLDAAITPDRKAWHKVEQLPQQGTLQGAQGLQQGLQPGLQPGTTTLGAAAAQVTAKAGQAAQTAPSGKSKPSWAA